MEDIVRPINFYSNFLPARKVDHSWQYCAFGILDGVSVEEPFYEKDVEDNTVLKQIWEHLSKRVKELKGNYAVQTIYAVCHADKQEEKAFWQPIKSEEGVMPFVFFCRAQYQGDLQSLRKNKAIIKEKLEKDGKIKTWIYLTYDNSDLLIVIKAVSYEIGAGAINSMHNNINFAFGEGSLCVLKNSFTVFAVDQEFINQLGDGKKEEEKSIFEYLNQTKIEQVVVKVIEKKFGCAKKLREELGKVHDNKKIQTKHLLGTDDELIILEEIGWGTFLRLYQNQEGFFYNAAPIYIKYIAGATTTICTSIEEKDYFRDWKISKVLLEQQEKWEKWYNKCIDNLRECLRKKEGDFKELYIILNTLPKFSGKVFSDYLYFSVLRPLRALIEFQPDRNAGQKCQGSHDDAYYEFIKGFNMYIQNSVKSDRHTMQMMDFNSKIYDIPVKLNAFYIAFIYNVCNMLNIPEEKEDKHRYDFLVVPGATNIVTVLELYSKQDNKKRLLRVEIPEDRFFDISNMMRVFSHEVAHYVGSGLRNRKNRYDSVVKNITDIYTNFVKSYWHGYKEQPSDEGWETVSQRLFYMLQDLLACKLDSEYLENVQFAMVGNSAGKMAERIATHNREYWSGLEFLRTYGYSDMSDILLTNLDNIYQDITYGMPEKEQNELLTKVEWASQRFLARHIEGSSLITMDTIFALLESVYEECFSDLASIFLLNLDARAYLDTLISDAGSQDMDVETLIETEVIYRITLVMDVLKEKKGDRWLEDVCHNDMLVKARLTIIKRSQIIYNSAVKSCKYDENYVISSFRALMDEKIYWKIRDYLCQCYDLFQAKIQRNTVSGIYRCLCNTQKSIEERIEQMEEYIEQFRKDIVTVFDKES